VKHVLALACTLPDTHSRPGGAALEKVPVCPGKDNLPGSISLRLEGVQQVKMAAQGVHPLKKLEGCHESFTKRVPLAHDTE